jgi:hypothetical protein
MSDFRSSSTRKSCSCIELMVACIDETPAERHLQCRSEQRIICNYPSLISFTLAILQAINHNIPASMPCKQINPIQHLKSKIMWRCLILYLKSCWHGASNVENIIELQIQ